MIDDRHKAMRRLGGFVYWGEYGDRDDLPVEAEVGDTARVRQKEYVCVSVMRGRRPVFFRWTRKRGAERAVDE